jgi:putative intracellular protease/amidase
MASQSLNGRMVAILLGCGSEQVEFTEPKKAAEAVGAGDYDAILIPAGVICYGPWTLVEAGAVRAAAPPDLFGSRAASAVRGRKATVRSAEDLHMRPNGPWHYGHA